TRVSNPVCSPRCRASVSVKGTFRSHCPADRLRHWCSSGSLRIPPLHPEFHLPLQYPSDTVAMADLGLSPRLSPRPYAATYAPFTPSDSGQRSRPLYYRGCWHRVSRRFLTRYRQSPRKMSFVPGNSGLHPEELPPARGVAASAFRPLRKIPHCCLPYESGPSLSPNVAGHHLR